MRARCAMRRTVLASTGMVTSWHGAGTTAGRPPPYSRPRNWGATRAHCPALVHAGCLACAFKRRYHVVPPDPGARATVSRERTKNAIDQEHRGRGRLPRARSRSVSASQLQAQEWPARPVKIVVAFAPGGSADQLGRLLAAELSTAFGQQFYVENKPGNSGSIGSALIARAEPDGYSLLVAGSGPHLTGPAINPNIGYDPLKDFTHIAMIGGRQLRARRQSCARRRLDRRAGRARPRQAADVVLAGRWLARPSHPGAVQAPGRHRHPARPRPQFRHARRARQSHLHVVHDPADRRRAYPLRRHGRARASRRASATRPIRSIPTFAEQGYPDVRGETWFWLAGPKNLPPGIVSRLNAEVRRIIRLPRTQAYMTQMALTTRDLDPAAVTDFVRQELRTGRRSPRRSACGSNSAGRSGLDAHGLDASSAARTRAAIRPACRRAWRPGPAPPPR